MEGYDHKLGDLFDYILQFLLTLESAGNRFEDIKEAYVRDLRTWKDEEPSVHASDYLEYLLSSKLYLNDDLLHALDGKVFSQPKPSLLAITFLMLGVKFVYRSYSICSVGLRKEIFLNCEVAVANLWKLYRESKEFVYIVFFICSHATAVIIYNFVGSISYSC